MREEVFDVVVVGGGTSEKTLKNENGAQLLTPVSLTVEIQAIGRGMTRPVSSL